MTKHLKDDSLSLLISIDGFGCILPWCLLSFSVSLFCAEPIGEPDRVGERTVGDIGVAEPESIEKEFILVLMKIKFGCLPDGKRLSLSEPQELLRDEFPGSGTGKSFVRF